MREEKYLVRTWANGVITYPAVAFQQMHCGANHSDINACMLHVHAQSFFFVFVAALQQRLMHSNQAWTRSSFLYFLTFRSVQI